MKKRKCGYPFTACNSDSNHGKDCPMRKVEKPVLAWGLKRKNGTLVPLAVNMRSDLIMKMLETDEIVKVEIREVSR